MPPRPVATQKNLVHNKRRDRVGSGQSRFTRDILDELRDSDSKVNFYIVYESRYYSLPKLKQANALS